MRACPLRRDRLLFLSIYACSGIALSFEALSILNLLQLATIRFAIGASVLVALIGDRLTNRSPAEIDRIDDGISSGKWAGWHLMGTSSEDTSRLFEAGVSLLLFVILTATAFTAISSVPNTRTR